MALLRMLQTIRMPILDVLVSLVTRLGEETIFLVLGLIILWCIDKKWGFRFLAAGLVGSIVNQLLKAIFLIPRPWVLDPSFEIVEAAREAATGYSFPSGHTQTAVTVYGMLAAWLKKTWVTVLCLILIALVGFSRMYLGVHTPYDVGVSLITGALTVFGMMYLFRRAEGDAKKEHRIQWGVFAFALVTLAYICLAPKRAANIAEFDAHGVENAWKLAGTTAGLIAAWLIDQKYVHYETKASLPVQVIKVALGFAIVMVVRMGTKPVLNVLMNGHAAAGAVRYFLMCVIGGGLWPMTFKYFARLGKE